jgi:hypothetical protein
LESLLPPIVRKILLRGFLGLAGAVVAVYFADGAQIRVRLATGGAAETYDSVNVIYAAGLKNSKYEVYAGQPTQQTCTLFPQLGYTPCWYLRRHPMQMID